MDSEATLRPGEVILKKYLIEEVLGEGGMGLVFKAKHLRIGESVALKLLHPEWARDPTIVARFEQEARSSIRIRSEHVAKVMDIETLESGAPLMVMELLHGRDLSDEILGRQVPLHEAVDIILQACTALAEAHALGIIHRDIKPANLFLTRRADGTRLLKVLDFGIAKALDEVPDNSSLTRTQDVIGSPMYMSPEQIRSSKNVDQRTDIWALGVIFFEMLSGETPFGGETSPAVLAAISADPPRDLPHEVENEQLRAFFQRALAKRPDARFRHIGEFAEALGDLSPGYDEVVVRINRIVHGQVVAPDSFQQTAPRFSGDVITRRSGSTTSDPTVLDESGRYAPLPIERKLTRNWLAWGAGALAVVAIFALLALMNSGSAKEESQAQEDGSPETQAKSGSSPAEPARESTPPPASAPVQEAVPVVPAGPSPRPPPAASSPPVGTARPGPAPARRPVSTPKPAPAPAPESASPRPSAGSLIEEATESRK